MTDKLRRKAYLDTIPWDRARFDFDQKLCETLHEKGWIQRDEIGGSGNLLLPERKEAPETKPRRKLRAGEHITRPWWETKNVWWPNPSKAEVDEVMSEYFSHNGKYFRSAYSANGWIYKSTSQR